jgi:hypothetical protein
MRLEVPTDLSQATLRGGGGYPRPVRPKDSSPGMCSLLDPSTFQDLQIPTLTQGVGSLSPKGHLKWGHRMTHFSPF